MMPAYYLEVMVVVLGLALLLADAFAGEGTGDGWSLWPCWDWRSSLR